MSLNRVLYKLVAAAVVIGALVPVVAAVVPTSASASLSTSTYLFVNENPNGPNVAASFRVDPSGNVASIGTFPTGGQGSDASFVASERADLSLDMAQTSGHLYVLNLGDNPTTLSIFSINAYTGMLTLQTGAPMPFGGHGHRRQPSRYGPVRR
jgi:hypothetical protein